jgi:hypothetical protein
MRFTKLIENITDKNTYIIIYSLLVIFVMDTSIVKISAFTGGFYYSQNFYNALFICTAASFGFIQFVILRVVKHKYHESVAQKKLKLHILSKLVGYANYGMIAILISIILEMSLGSSYNIGFVFAIIWTSYGITLVMLSFLSFIFLRWFKRVKSPVILAYATAILMISINIVIAIIFISIELGGFDNIIYPSTSPVGHLNISSILLNNLYNITFVMSFILTWSATAILLNYYSRVIGKAKYWVLISIPLVYFLASFQSLIVDLFLPLRLADPLIFGVIYTLTFSATKPAGAILFGIAFWALARNLLNRTVKNYMVICSYGMIILFAANQPIGLLLTPYPPFGLTTVSFMAVASFLILIGFYSAAISVSLDSSVRKSIKKTAISQSQLLDKLGIAEYEREIERRVIMVTKKTKDLIENEAGITTSLSPEDIRAFIAEISEEIKSKKGQ